MTVPFVRRILTDNHLKAIGIVAAEWSYTEVVLQDLIWEVAGIDHERGYAITSDLRSETRINMLEALAHTRLTTPTLKAKLRKVVADVRRLRTERNAIVHAFWLPSKPPILSIIAPPKKRKSIPKSIHIKAKGKVVITNKPYTAKQILSIASEIADLYISLSVLLGEIEDARKQREMLSKSSPVPQTLAQLLDPKPKG